MNKMTLSKFENVKQFNFEQFKDEFGNKGVSDLINNILTILVKEKKEISLLDLKGLANYFESFTFIVYNRHPFKEKIIWIKKDSASSKIESFIETLEITD